MAASRLFRVVIGVVAVATAGFFLYGCGAAGGSSGPGSGGGETVGEGEEVSLPEGPPGIVGVVTEVGRDPGGGAEPLGTILVEESPGQGKPVGCAKGSGEKGCNKLLLSITEGTSILREVGEDAVPAAGSDLRSGQRVRAWHEDVVTRSYPGQTIARVVVIEGTG